MSRHFIGLILMAFVGHAHAATVAFLELRDDNGNTVQLEPGGRFGHVAIRMEGRWLHAHPYRGVDLVHDIEEYGYDIELLVHHGYPDPTFRDVQHWLGKPFDMQYRWNCSEATYCSRLVAEILGVPPQPMDFKSSIWEKHSYKNIGEPGLSPDELYRALRTRGFYPTQHCGLLLAPPRPTFQEAP